MLVIFHKTDPDFLPDIADTDRTDEHGFLSFLYIRVLPC